MLYVLEIVLKMFARINLPEFVNSQTRQTRIASKRKKLNMIGAKKE